MQVKVLYSVFFKRKFERHMLSLFAVPSVVKSLQTKQLYFLHSPPCYCTACDMHLGSATYLYMLCPSILRVRICGHRASKQSLHLVCTAASRRANSHDDAVILKSLG
ncbi:hypothetical protein HOLleu_14543 [Holothuria leucospilota]|uniref:Uncharacterized protein n=1 Tax=Holothuria leucospilota TaxID=206669 RepID=A0A9Q1C6M3_HOLLE|nr:hypothetical protein HOLleu_14543 [Holothuria leucospilota]